MICIQSKNPISSFAGSFVLYSAYKRNKKSHDQGIIVKVVERRQKTYIVLSRNLSRNISYIFLSRNISL